jgi:hypothetical protein
MKQERQTYSPPYYSAVAQLGGDHHYSVQFWAVDPAYVLQNPVIQALNSGKHRYFSV